MEMESPNRLLMQTFEQTFLLPFFIEKIKSFVYSWLVSILLDIFFALFLFNSYSYRFFWDFSNISCYFNVNLIKGVVYTNNVLCLIVLDPPMELILKGWLDLFPKKEDNTSNFNYNSPKAFPLSPPSFLYVKNRIMTLPIKLITASDRSTAVLIESLSLGWYGIVKIVPKFPNNFKWRTSVSLPRNGTTTLAPALAECISFRWNNGQK